jgi:translocation and assembly module TamB
LQLALQADKLEVLSRPDRLLILSGTGNASWVDKHIQVHSSLKADRGLIELPNGDAPTVSDDVVVLGQKQVVARKKPPYAIRFDLDMDLGERFYLKGHGLDAQLGGAVKLTSVEGGLPRSSGSIRIVKGAYAAYGQKLDIERGILNFQGPVDNPGLNIVAMRRNQDVDAGVAVSGSAQAPVVRLVSSPTVPDSEKLSWLVLGHGIESSSGQEFSALQAAAGALLAAGESVTLQQRVAHAAGLEEVSLRGAGTLEGTVLTLGKRLSSRAYLSYDQSLSGAETVAKINYTLTQRLSVRAQAGTVPAVDLFYTFSFD